MKSRIIIFLNICLLLGLTACSDLLDDSDNALKSFLTEEPDSKISNELISQSPQIANAYLLGIYRDWRECHRKWGSYAIGTDEFKLGGVQWRDDTNKKGIEMYSNSFSSTNGHTLEYWKTRYQIISKATLAIDNLKKYEDSPEDNEEFLQYYAESCALRGACYFELVQCFGPIPLNNTEVIAQHGSKRQELSLVYEKIVEDLTVAAKYLPEHSDPFFSGDEMNRRRFSKAFAHAMLGKTYLYAPAELRNYEEAAKYFEIVYNDPAFGQKGASKYTVIFDETAQSENSPDYEREMIYAFRFKPIRGDNNEFQWNFGSRAVAQATPVEATSYFAGFDHIMPTKYCYSMRTKRDDKGLWDGLWENESDVRRNLSIRYDFTVNGKQPELTGYCYGDELNPHIKKYEDKRTEESGLNTWHSGKNVPYIRFSDVVLCYAECLSYTGKRAEGIKLINEIIRMRAFNTSRPTGPNMWDEGMGEEEFLEKLLDERMRELCFEGWRRMDLIRMSKVKEYVPERNSWFQNEAGAVVATIDETRFRFPIPLDELQMNPDMSPADQNIGY